MERWRDEVRCSCESECGGSSAKSQCLGPPHPPAYKGQTRSSTRRTTACLERPCLTHSRSPRRFVRGEQTQTTSLTITSAPSRHTLFDVETAAWAAASADTQHQGSWLRYVCFLPLSSTPDTPAAGNTPHEPPNGPRTAAWLHVRPPETIAKPASPHHHCQRQAFHAPTATLPNNPSHNAIGLRSGFRETALW